MNYGYSRVSSTDQNLARQREAMKEFGEDIVVFEDKQSGKNFDRPEYKKMIAVLRAGDLVVVKSIDRLGRNYDEILEQWRIITKELEADILVLDMPLLDTRGGRDLTGRLIADIVLQLLSYVAETERANIKQRQKEGIEAMPVVDGRKVSAKTGRGFGRPKGEYDAFPELLAKTKSGLLTVSEAAKELGVSRTQWYRIEKQNASPAVESIGE